MLQIVDLHMSSPVVTASAVRPDQVRVRWQVLQKKIVWGIKSFGTLSK